MADSTITIDRWLGLHVDNAGDTNLKLGELSRCDNIRIIENYKAKKRNGYIKLFNSIATNKKIQGIWYGKVSGSYHFLFACNGHIYKLNLEDNAYDDIGSLVDDVTNFFFYGQNVYILNGHDYYFWTGTGNIQVVEGYRPIIRTACVPLGAGTELEDLNLLNGKKAMRYTTDGTAYYKVAESDIESIDYVKQYDAEVPTSWYTVDLPAGAINFNTGHLPSNGIVDGVEIGWTKGDGYRDELVKKRYSSILSDQGLSMIAFYGDGTNRVYFNGLEDVSKLYTAEYIPVNNYTDVGSTQYPVTQILQQFEKQVTYTTNTTHYIEFEFNEVFQVNAKSYPVNDKIGNVAIGQGQLIVNNPFTLSDEEIYEWEVVSLNDKRSARAISGRIRAELKDLDLSKAITTDYKKEGELWITIDNAVYIYNYKLDVFYKFILHDTPSCFIEVDGSLYFGTTNGQIMKFTETALSDNGNVIDARLETGFMDFGQSYRNKFLNLGWIGLKPESKSVCYIEWDVDSDTDTHDVEPVSYNLADFGNIDFSDFSFQTSYNPKPFKIKMKCKKFCYFKLILSNSDLYSTMTILNATLPAMIGGTV